MPGHACTPTGTQRTHTHVLTFVYAYKETQYRHHCVSADRLVDKWVAHHQQKGAWGDAMTLLGQALVFDISIRTVKGVYPPKGGKRVSASATMWRPAKYGLTVDGFNRDNAGISRDTGLDAMERVQARAYENEMYAFLWIVLNFSTTNCAMSTEVEARVEQETDNSLRF